MNTYFELPKEWNKIPTTPEQQFKEKVKLENECPHTQIAVFGGSFDGNNQHILHFACKNCKKCGYRDNFPNYSQQIPYNGGYF